MISCVALLALGFLASICFSQGPKTKDRDDHASADKPKKTTESYVVLGYNDLGMHCMNQDFSHRCILPPYNSLHAQVIQIGREERLL